MTASFHIRRISFAIVAVLLLMAALLPSMFGVVPARAELDKLFAVDAISVDETAADATQAKMKAIVKAQRQAFLTLVRRLGGEAAATRLAKLSDRDIGRLLSSLSIADEQTGPTRYIAKITIRFNPAKMIHLLRRKGVAFTTRQAPPVLIVPVWQGEDGQPLLWEDNPWLKAWRKLADEHALVPVVIPAGDDVDRNTLDAMQAMESDRAALQALQMRYGAEHVLVAIARPVDGNTVQAAMVGRSPGGKVLFDKTYQVEQGGLDAAAEHAVRRFMEVMNLKWRNKMLKAARERAAARAAARRAAANARRITVIVPFSGLRQWQALRARLTTTPGIGSVDVRQLSGTHAVVQLGTSLSAEQLRAALANAGLLLQRSGGQWYVRGY